jgi:hypothetical protein
METRSFMKKLCALMVVGLLLAAMPAALASSSSAAEMAYDTYVNETYGYSVDYPAEWVLLDSDTVGAVLEQLTSGDLTIEGITSDALDALKTLMSGDMTGFAEFIDGNGNSFNVTCFTYPTPASIDSAMELLVPQIIASYQQTFSDITVLDSGSVYTVDDSEFIKAKCMYTIDGMTVLVTPLFLFENDLLFNISFTWVTTGDDEVQALDQIMESVLASFSLV